MKILYITNSLEPKDGWGRYGSDIVNEISKDNNVLVVCSDLYNEAKVTQYKILHSIHNGLNPFKIFSSYLKVQKIINTVRPDVIHFIAEPYVMILPFIKFKSSTKVFLTIHGTYSFLPSLFKTEKVKKFISSQLVNIAYRRLTSIISVSSFTKQYLLKQYKDFYGTEFDQNKIVVVTNGINLMNFAHSPDIIKNTNIKSILFVGAIKNRKGILESLSALNKYKSKYGSGFVYNIVGSYKEEDPYFQKVKKTIQDLDLQHEVKLMGRVTESELKNLYSTSNLFLMLPIKDGFSVEGFGLVYLEANAYGVPVIGSINSGAEDAILDGTSGYLVDPFDSNSVSERIHSILDVNSIDKYTCLEWANKNDIIIKTMELKRVYFS